MLGLGTLGPPLMFIPGGKLGLILFVRGWGLRISPSSSSSLSSLTLALAGGAGLGSRGPPLMVIPGGRLGLTPLGGPPLIFSPGGRCALGPPLMLTPGGKLGLGPPLTLIPGGRFGRGPPLTLIPGGRFGRGPPLTLIPGGSFGLGPPVTVMPGGSLGASLELLATDMPSFESLSMSLFLSGSSDRDTWIPNPASLSMPADLCTDLEIPIETPLISNDRGSLTQSLQPCQWIYQGGG